MKPFDNWTDRDIVDLVDAYPLALVFTSDGAGAATPLPMMIETDEGGRPISLLGHFARRNPQVAAVRANPRTQFLFMGPHAYISPETVTVTSDWAPTWNYAFARIIADVTFDDALNHEAVGKLVEKMERGRSNPWTRAAIGERYDQLIRHIIAFRAPIVAIDGRFKLGQDERSEVRTEIEAAVAPDLAAWMRRFNDG